ncbi:MAG: acyl-CoA dehydrogenase protein [Frankiales bacterium]|nr:acyl-CoA dehydrogenase protein [Frankiales bacterium]
MYSTIDREDDDRQLLRKSVAAVASQFGHTYFREKSADPDGRAHELWAALAETGFTSVNLPEAYGGGGAGLTELTVVCEEVAATGAPLLLLIVSPAICGNVIASFGTEEQKAHWLPKFCGQDTGEWGATWKMAFAITEPDAGSNSHNLSTNAKLQGDGTWVLNGKKTYISGVDEAEAMLVVARTGTDEKTGKAQLSLFIVDSDAKGMTKTVIETEVIAPEKQYALFFDDVIIPADRVVGTPNDGLRQVFVGLNPERIAGAAMLNGIGRYALDRAAQYAREREVWGVPIGSHQGISHPMAEAKIQLELARLMTTRAAELYDAGLDAGEAANVAKFAAAEAALKCVDVAIQTFGGNGVATEYGIMSMWGMARLLRIAPVSREMVLNYIAQHSLRLPRSY